MGKGIPLYCTIVEWVTVINKLNFNLIINCCIQTNGQSFYIGIFYDITIKVIYFTIINTVWLN